MWTVTLFRSKLALVCTAIRGLLTYLLGCGLHRYITCCCSKTQGIAMALSDTFEVKPVPTCNLEQSVTYFSGELMQSRRPRTLLWPTMFLLQPSTTGRAGRGMHHLNMQAFTAWNIFTVYPIFNCLPLPNTATILILCKLCTFVVLWASIQVITERHRLIVFRQ